MQKALRTLMNERCKVTFGVFELRLQTRELYKQGVRVRLQGKPFRILRALVLRPNEVVTREELRTELWSSDTFVDFESGLNTAVNRLRLALGDSAENPLYIETLARIGYRFVAPITVVVEKPERAPSGVTVPTPTAAMVSTRAKTWFASLRKRWKWMAAAAALLTVSSAAVWEIDRTRSAVSFHELTFQRGFVSNARFTRDGKQVVYSARWNDGPTRLFLARSDGAKTDTPEFRVLESSPTVELASVSEDRVAFFEQAKEDGRYVLEWRALRSGTSHPVSDHIAAADWTPDGKLCLVRARAGTDTVEFPEGHPVYRSSGWISDLRVSPAGNEVAFLEHPLRTDDAGQVVAVDRSGRSHVLSAGWGSTDGLAWHPATDEVWFTAARSGIDRVLMAVNRRGRTRQIAQVPGGMRLLDVSATGQVLISRNTSHMLMLFGKLHESAARNISFLDWSCVAAISRDGQQVLFDESGAGGGQRYSVYLYTAQTQSSERLGDGRAMDLSADGRWALSQAFNDTHTLYLISTQSRKVATVSNYGFEYTWAKFLPGSGPGSPEILFEGNMPEEKPGLYRQRIPDGKPILVKPGIQLFQPVIDPQLQLLAGVNEDSNLAVLDLARRDMRIVRPSRPVFPVAFLAPGKLLTSHTNSASVLLDVLDPGTGELIPYKKLDPPDGAGTSEVFPIHFAGDLDTFAYSRVQSLSQLYSVSGWS